MAEPADPNSTTLSDIDAMLLVALTAAEMIAPDAEDWNEISARVPPANATVEKRCGGNRSTRQRRANT